MEIKMVCILFLLLIISMGAVTASEESSDIMEVSDATEVTQNDGISYTFKNLTDDVKISGDSFDVQHDYTFNNETDDGYVVISKNDFVINGNNHIINGNEQSGIFNITGNNVTIRNLIFTNGKSAIGGIIDSTGEVTLDNVTFILNNVTFISDHTKYLGGAIANHGGKINCYNSSFIDNHAESGAAIFIENGELNIYNTNITSSIPNMYGQIWARFSTVNIDYLNLINASSRYSPAISVESCSNTRITNSRFINLTADMSAGAISLKVDGDLYIQNCEFINTQSFKNAGAVIADYRVDNCAVTILDTLFCNSSSLIGGAYVQLGSSLVMNNTRFINNNATHCGGALYLSLTNSEINNCTFDSNSAEDLEDYPGLGGAIYSDYDGVTIDCCKFINNSASMGNAIYFCDSDYEVFNTTFINNKNAIFSFFDKGALLENNKYNNDSVLNNQTFEYEKYIDTPGLTFDPITNNIEVSTIPTRFDLRDWGWVTPVKHQGHMGACWTFGTIGALESAILKAYGIELNLSEGNLHHSMIRYSHYGFLSTNEGGTCVRAVSYLLGWYGPNLEEYDVYDEVGKLSPDITSLDYDIIHLQDVIFIPRNMENNNSELKLAILKYGAVGGGYYAEYGGEGFYDSQRASHYTNESRAINHIVAIVGWDDNYSRDNFLITPPGDGAWIIKNSWGTDFGDGGYLYLSYYDKTFLSQTNVDYFAMAVVLENTIPYNKNYQHDYTWDGEFLNAPDNNIAYANVFNAAADDLLAAVGTYFQTGGENYTVTIKVNGEVKLVQEGISPYCGYHTIKLDKYIPIKKEDVFFVAITAGAMPYTGQQATRVHYVENTSFLLYEGEWVDTYKAQNMIACIKAYTVNDDTKVINAKDIAVDYVGGKYFSVKVVTADGHAVGEGAKVKFTINKKTTTVTTDKNGVAKIKITDGPGKYTLITTYKGKAVAKNTVTVKHILTATKQTVKKTAKSFTLKATLKINGKLVKGKWITFKFNGKTYRVKTNSKGVAQKILGKNVIKKLKKGKTYTVKVTYLKDTIKTTVKVR